MRYLDTESLFLLYGELNVSSTEVFLELYGFLCYAFPRDYTPIANMATISPKRGFSVVTVAKGWPALFFPGILQALH